jgi:hypothetical protein
LDRIIKLIPIALILVMLISLSVATGCSDDQADKSEEFTKEELAQIVADSNQAIYEVESYKMKMNMDASMEISGGDEEGTMNMNMTADSVVDQKNMEMQMVMAMKMDMDMDELGDGPMDMDMDMEMCVVDDYVYMKADLFGTGEEWIKMPATDDVMSMYDLNMVEQQLAPLESLVEATFLRYETYDGSECYVIELVPDMGAMMDWLNDQDMTGVEFGLDDLDKLNDMFQNLSYTCWIDKETKYMKKVTAHIVMKMSADDFDETDYGMGTLIMDMTMNMEMSNYNEPVTIILPEEAQEATEFSI